MVAIGGERGGEAEAGVVFFWGNCRPRSYAVFLSLATNKKNKS